MTNSVNHVMPENIYKQALDAAKGTETHLYVLEKVDNVFRSRCYHPTSARGIASECVNTTKATFKMNLMEDLMTLDRPKFTVVDMISRTLLSEGGMVWTVLSPNIDFWSNWQRPATAAAFRQYLEKE